MRKSIKKYLENFKTSECSTGRGLYIYYGKKKIFLDSNMLEDRIEPAEKPGRKIKKEELLTCTIKKIITEALKQKHEKNN